MPLGEWRLVLPHSLAHILYILGVTVSISQARCVLEKCFYHPGSCLTELSMGRVPPLESVQPYFAGVLQGLVETVSALAPLLDLGESLRL